MRANRAQIQGSARVPVLAYHKYLGRDSQSVYSNRYFCGACGLGIGGTNGSPYGHPETPERLEAENAGDGFGPWERSDEPLLYYAFCPWCGAQFEDDWRKNQPIQNERAIDHTKDPGTHKGDEHVFSGFEPTNHWLATTGSQVCWCDPVIEPGLMGCTVRHQDKDYDEYVAAVRAAAAKWDDDDA